MCIPCGGAPAGTPSSAHRNEELWSGEPNESSPTSFSDLFKKVALRPLFVTVVQNAGCPVLSEGSRLLIVQTTGQWPRVVVLHAQVKVEDFSSYLAKLSTPRELMIMMTEMWVPFLVTSQQCWFMSHSRQPCAIKFMWLSRVSGCRVAGWRG